MPFLEARLAASPLMRTAARAPNKQDVEVVVEEKKEVAVLLEFDDPESGEGRSITIQNLDLSGASQGLSHEHALP